MTAAALNGALARAEAHMGRALPVDADARQALSTLADGDGRYLIGIAEQLAQSAPLALRGTLDAVNVGGECGIEEGLQYETAQFGLMFSTDDMREGTRAFLERRKPVFSGR